MGIEPYAIRSGLRAVVGQRLVRRLCPECSSLSERAARRPARAAGRSSPSWPAAATHAEGPATGAGIVLAELLLPDQEQLGLAILQRRDVHQLEEIALAAGMIGRWERACQAVEEGLTSPAEVRRVLGLSTPRRKAASGS